MGAYLGNQNGTRAKNLHPRQPSNCRASVWVLGDLTEFQSCFRSLISHQTMDKSLPLSQSWLPEKLRENTGLD